jgi:hypothetical protein
LDCHILEFVLLSWDMHLHEDDFNVSVLQTFIAKGANQRDILFEILEVSKHSLGNAHWFLHSWVPLLFKDVSKFHSCGSHLAMLSLDLIGNEVLE